MLVFIQIVLVAVVLIAGAVIVTSYAQYRREGGEPYRPWFIEQRTARGTQLAMRSRRAAVVALLALGALSIIDMATTG